MKIFSESTRTDPSPAAHGTSTFQFLDRVSGSYWDQVRALIQDWFTRFPTSDQADLRARLRSKDERQHNGAFFELYLHECLLRMGYTVTCHPDLEGTTRHPDFLAEKDGTSVYVEARATSASNEATAAAARVKDVYASLDKMHSPNFFLWIDVAAQGPQPMRARTLRRDLEKWLATLNPDNHRLGGPRTDLPGFTHDDSGWRIEFRAIPKSPEARSKDGVRPLGMFGGGRATWVRDEEGIRGALADKGSAYGALGAPFVVAVASGSLSLDDDDVLDALYGTEAVLVETGQSIRRADGYWYMGDHWAHRGVSAVLVVKNLHPVAVGTQRHTMWHHPDPEFAAPQLPLWRQSMAGDEGQMMFVEPVRSQADWFGLGTPWPVGEAFPRK